MNCSHQLFPCVARRACQQTQDASSVGSRASIVAFDGPRLSARKADGALVMLAVSPFGSLLSELASVSRWDEAVRLARFAKSNTLWAALAAMALLWKHLDTAEAALAAIGDIAKLNFLLKLRRLRREEARAAELALLRGRIDEAEAILLQASPPLVFRAIKLNTRLFRWERCERWSLTCVT